MLCYSLLAIVLRRIKWQKQHCKPLRKKEGKAHSMDKQIQKDVIYDLEIP